ncbi:uracil-DNA glycosylase [Rhabdaerophilum sp. SD176]|uniref:uracil-DNA glycosylase n=1 Tax=Rhabdaerophilum sp. SD176 TaxID=2983548 RepID=UPI0024DFCC27|nr:uracil-DNA glycosylase [Rhabdaerophilum sp. SD176]
MTEPQSPRRILEFLAAAGVDMIVGDEPVNRMQPPPPLPERQAEAQPGRAAPDVPAPVQAPVSLRVAPTAPDDAIMQARLQARSAASLEELATIMAAFDGCALKATASRLVFADGIPQARVMIIGEAPGREEDETGRPFVGRAGQLLDKMLKAIGLDRSSVYIANVVPWRPPGNRTPTPQEVAICLPFIHRQIELAAPDLLLTMGAPATQNLTGRKDGILRLRGQWFEVDVAARTIPTLATLHPAYLLRQPGQKALAWRDLRALKARLAAE